MILVKKKIFYQNIIPLHLKTINTIDHSIGNYLSNSNALRKMGSIQKQERKRENAKKIDYPC